MIGALQGEVISIERDAAVIMVQGVGYEVHMTSSDLSELHIGSEQRIHTVMVSSQDNVSLYGFVSLQSKRMFLQLQKASGVGPKVALSIVATLPADRLVAAISNNDVSALCKSPGLGKKGAQKIILELKGSINLEDVPQQSSPSAGGLDSSLSQVVEGLISLGWKPADAHHAVQLVCEQHHIEPPCDAVQVPQLLRLALATLDRGR